MAVLVELDVRGATLEQMYRVEELTRLRGQAAGRPPYTGCMFIAATAVESGFHFVSAWRTEPDFRSVLASMLGPDLATQGLEASGISVSPVVSMAIPGTNG